MIQLRFECYLGLGCGSLYQQIDNVGLWVKFFPHIYNDLGTLKLYDMKMQ